jgi:membrane-bound lytic murein transglycosylase A
MGAPLKAIVLTVPAVLAVTVLALQHADARRYYGYIYRAYHARYHDVTGAIPRAAQQPAIIVDTGPGPLKIPNAALEPARWSDLDGWSGDDHASAYATLSASCRSIVRGAAFRAEQSHAHDARAAAPAHAAAPTAPAAGDSRPVRAALEQVCARAIKAGPLKGAAAREFFEANFVPVRIRKLGEAAGFLTGYYEPIVDGSRFPTREFSVPIYRRPPDLTAPGLADGAPFPNTGKAFRRTASGELVPYYDRGAIEDGALDGQHLEICWVRSQTDALFIGIEGSAQIRLEDGTMMHINYDAHNGFPYVPVGRVLIERGLVPREEMSMQRIREWMHDNPEGAKEVRRQNRSMVFFRIVGLDSGVEALGAQGIPLSAGRSIAVDKNLHVYGTPFFIEADLPLTGARNTTAFRRTMIAQDTGSAIVGPARADLFFGAGDEAGQMAGRIKQAGRFTMLLPRELDPTVAGAHMPLPPVKLAARGGAGRALPETGTALPEAATKALPEAPAKPLPEVATRSLPETETHPTRRVLNSAAAAREVRERRRVLRYYWQ